MQVADCLPEPATPTSAPLERASTMDDARAGGAEALAGAGLADRALLTPSMDERALIMGLSLLDQR